MNDRLPVVLGAPGRCAHGRSKRNCLLCAQAAIQKQEIEITRLRAEVERLRGELKEEMVRWWVSSGLWSFAAFGGRQPDEAALEQEARRRLAEENSP